MDFSGLGNMRHERIVLFTLTHSTPLECISGGLGFLYRHITPNQNQRYEAHVGFLGYECLMAFPGREERLSVKMSVCSSGAICL